MTDLSLRMRERVVETLSLISSEGAQRKYQLAAPDVDVPAELFNQWDDFYFPDDEVFRQGFRPAELEALRHFNDVIAEVSNEMPQKLPPLNLFIVSSSWCKLSEAASSTLRALSMKNALQ